ncbi:MAG: Rab family GTPase [Candidatus Heimdallarchaeaceae archaeon]
MVRFKVLILGDTGVGKSVLYKSLVLNEKDKTPKPAIKAKITEIRRKIEGEDVIIDLYDLPAREFLTPQRAKWFLGTDGAFIVFDISKADTFRRVSFWLEQLLNYNRKGKVPIVLVGNKSDLREASERTLNPIDAKSYCMRLNRTSSRENIKNEFFEISAAQGKSITQILDVLVRNMYNRYKARKI